MSNAQLKIILKLKDQATKQYLKFSQKIQNRTKTLVKNLKKYWIAYAAAIAVTVIALKRFTEVLVRTASTVEDLKVRLETLLGSVEEGGKVFEAMSRLASKVPKTYEEIMQSATDLAGVVRGGSAEIEKLMPIIVDISAGTGMAVRDVTSQMIRMYSAGAAAADSFRERGVSAALGFQAGVKYTAEETMQKIVKSWENGTSKYVGASKRLATTWTGLMSMMKDAWFNFTKDIGKDIFKKLKEDMQAVYLIITESKEEGGKYSEVVNDLNTDIGNAYTSLKEFFVASILGAGTAIDMWRDLRVAVTGFAIWTNKAAKAVLKFEEIKMKVSLVGWLPGVKKQFKDATDALDRNIDVWTKGLAEAQDAASVSAEQRAKDFINNIKLLMSEMKAELDGVGGEGAGAMPGAEAAGVPGVGEEGLSVEDKLTRETEWTAILKQLQSQNTEYLLAELNKRKEAYLALGKDRLKIDEWYQEQYTKVVGAKKSMFEGLTGRIQSVWSSAIFNMTKGTETFKGFWKSTLDVMKRYFIEKFTTSILDGFMNMLSKMKTSSGGGLISSVLGMIPGVGGLLGGAASLFGFEEGTERVPRTGPAIIHKDEAVIPASINPFNPSNRGKGGFGTTIAVENHFYGDVYTREDVDNLDVIKSQIGDSISNAMRSFA